MVAKHSTRAFTATELVVFLSIATLVIFGACMIFLGTLQSVTRINEQSDNVRESARIQRRLLSQAGEAMFVQLPEAKLQNNDWPSSTVGLIFKYQSGWSLKGFLNGKLDLKNTGMLVYLPARYNLALRNASGSSVALSGELAPFKRTIPGMAALIYRGNKEGEPDPNKGEFLWLRNQTGTSSFSRPILVTQNLSTQQGAVSLERDDDRVDVLRASLILKETALAGDEKNPIEFTIKAGNYSSDAEKLVKDVVK